jgi:toxin YoeB
MLKVTFYPKALQELFEMGLYDKMAFKRIEKIIRDIQRTPFEGIGKPEALKHNFAGLWSRRIDDKNRIIYEVQDAAVCIVSCKGHYDDK